MAIIKCKMCGGDMEIIEGVNVAKCEYCGSTMTLPKVEDEQRAAAFNRGNHFRRIGEFDKALAVYERIVQEDETDAEAHWCCALCRFGIEYVKDPASGAYLPTCHRASYDSFLEDVDYKATLQYADVVARSQYEKDGKIITQVQRDILEISQKEKPFDVFLCYKENDENGNRTVDSTLAQDIYYQLTDQGYRVFFSRITLEDKGGEKYEPYIFAALQSSKVMLVVGTKPEYLNAVWVKNEWSRFLSLMKTDRKRLLIPCYRDMDPYDMPEQLSVLQAYDMSKIGFMQDLIRGISKVLEATKKPVQKETVVVQQEVSANLTALLKRGKMALEDCEWEEAREYFDRVLDMDAECAEAYLGKFLAENEESTLEDLEDTRLFLTELASKEKLQAGEKDIDWIESAKKEYAVPGYLSEDEIEKIYDFDFSYISTQKDRLAQLEREESFWDDNKLYQRALKFASGADRQQLKSAEADVIAAMQQRYQDAKAEDEGNVSKIKTAYQIHLQNADKKVADKNRAALDSKEKDRVAAEKERLAAEKQAEQERTALEKQRLLEERRRAKIEKVAAAITALFIGCFAVYLVVDQVVLPAKHYSDAEALLEQKDYDAAAEAFIALGSYKDAEDRAHDARYQGAENLLAQKDYDAAVEAFTALGTYEDAEDRVKEVRYQEAEELLTLGDCQGAAFQFGKASGYKDARERSLELWGDVLGDSIVVEMSTTVGLKTNGTVVATGSNDDGREGWRDIVAISGNSEHTVGLKSDGTVVATAYYGNYRRNIESWRDIVAISVGAEHTVALKLDGTVVATGSDDNHGECDTDGWTDIVAIFAGNHHTVGLKADGTVVATGYNNDGRCNVESWTDIVAISVGAFHTVGLKADGTVVTTGSNSRGQCNVEGWTDIVAISAGYEHTVGLKTDGTVVAVGANGLGECNVNDWSDIVAIFAGDMHTVGLKGDGTVVATGSNSSGQCNVEGWTDIVTISIGTFHTVGLKADGTVVATGDNWAGQCNVNDWTNIKIPG